ncbi:unnamed protein product [Lactuca saligna]|uniref:Uncharacterized protein n=1 Tax=Lactuca saligna TaxID=75948 RepID=A0AA35YG33_LACSI|nr:unnamed protein product [Lactuca saligna]
MSSQITYFPPGILEYEDAVNLIPPEMSPSTVWSFIFYSGTLHGRWMCWRILIHVAVDVLENFNSCEAKSGNQHNGDCDGGKELLNEGEINGLFYPRTLTQNNFQRKSYVDYNFP